METVFYVAILSLCLMAVTETLIITVRSYGVLRAAQIIETDAAVALERMTREIRDAKSVSLSGSVLGSHPGVLFLNSTTLAGAPRTVEFLLENGKLSLKENGVSQGALTGERSAVAYLVFRRIVTARSEGVKVELTLQSGTGVASSTEKFYATAVLRDSY